MIDLKYSVLFLGFQLLYFISLSSSIVYKYPALGSGFLIQSLYFRLEKIVWLKFDELLEIVAIPKLRPFEWNNFAIWILLKNISFN